MGPSAAASGSRYEAPVVRPGYRADVQGLRAVAVVAVVAYHAGLPLPGGFVGVDVFFVISGFVITALLVRELDREGRVDLRRFYLRRVRRLLPALALVVSVTLVASALLQSSLGAQQDTAVVAVAAAAWLANGALYLLPGGYFDLASEQNPLLHTWSLAVEEQFYLVFPVLLILTWAAVRRWGGPGRPVVRVAVVLGLLAACSLALSLAFSYGWTVPGVRDPAAFAFFSSPTRAWEFAAGGIVALLLPPGGGSVVGGRPTVVPVLLGWLGAGLLTVSFLVVDRSTVFPGVAVLLPVTGTVLLLVAGGLPGAPWRRVLGSAPAVRLGDLSYSWYLWHWPVIVLSAVLWPTSAWVPAAAALVSLLPAWASYRWVEQPVRQGQVAALRPVGRLVAACLGTSVVLGGALWGAAQAHWGHDRVAYMADQVAGLPLGYDTGCHDGPALPLRDLAPCTWHGDAAGRRVFLLGDSTAGQYADGLVLAGERLGRPVTVATRSGCAFIGTSVVASTVATEPCREYVDGTVSWLLTQEPAVVVVAAANATAGNPDVVLVDPLDGRTATTDDAKAEMWEEGAARTHQQLVDAGHDVLHILPTPHFGDGDSGWWDPRLCPHVLLARGTDRCGEAMSRETADERQASALEADRGAAARSGARPLDLRDELCPDGVCGTHEDDSWAFRDGLHITTGQSLLLADRLEQALAESPP